LGGETAELLALLGTQVLPHFSSPQNLLLAIRRQTVEMLQPLLKLLLPLHREPFELRIVLQSAPLLIRWLSSLLIQPLAKMMALCRRLVIAALLRS
jgi:hypothetical protein